MYQLLYSLFLLLYLESKTIGAHGQQAEAETQALVQALDLSYVLIGGRELVHEHLHEGLGVDPVGEVAHLEKQN